MLGQSVQDLKREAIALKRDQILLEYDLLPGGRDTAVRNVVPLERDTALLVKELQPSYTDLLKALARLQVEAQWANPKLDPYYVDLSLGRLYGEYGLPELSAERYAHLNNAGDLPALRSEAFHRLALYQYRRGDYAQASRSLDKATAGHRDAPQHAWPLFQSLVLLRAQRNDQAERFLLRGTFPQQDPWSSYNLGVAELRLGQLELASGMLDTIGTMPGDTEEMRSLRDLANLVLGYAFLEADQGGTARALFQRVRLGGPYSSRALLGAGWAELAPDGVPQQNTSLSADAKKDSEIRKERTPFEFIAGGKNQSLRYERALRLWMTLIRRDPSEPAVQEAWLGAAYVTGKLYGPDQGAERYRQAIALFETERTHVLDALQAVRNSRIRVDTPADPTSTWQRRIWDLPRPQDARYLLDSLTGDAMEAAVADYRDLRRLSLTIDEIDAQLSGMNVAGVMTNLNEVEPAAGRLERLRNSSLSLRAKVDSAVVAQEYAIRALGEAELQNHLKRLDTYQVQARFSLARLLDPSLNP